MLVASPLPQLDRELEYLIPEALLGRVAAGMRVRVPVRSAQRQLDAFVLEVRERPSFEGRLAELSELVSEARVLIPEISALARRVADRQAGCAADVLRLAIPPRQVRVERTWLAERAEPVAQADDALGLDGAAPILRGHLGATGLAQLLHEQPTRIALAPPAGVDAAGVPLALVALAELCAWHLSRGRSAILAVPDFRDVELALRALRDRVPAEVVRRLDTRSKPAARYRDFLRCLEDRPQLVVGTRTAVYAPVSRLGLIAMWDDGDESFVEPLAPYAHAREVALTRQQLRDCSLVLAAHSPSLETRRLVAIGWLRELRGSEAHPRIVPTAAVIGQEAQARHARIPSIAWRAAADALEGGPVLVQVAAPGYLPAVVCAQCRTLARCRECAGPLQLERSGAPPRCRICGAVHADWHCAACGHDRLRAASIGAARTVEELGRAFPGVPVRLADGEHEHIDVPGRPALVVATRGTEPVAHGGYAAVLLLDGERMLARERLDAGVDVLRWWSNAAALAAPKAPVVLVGAEEGPGRALHAWRQPGYVDAELAVRRQLVFPPAVRAGTITGSAAEVERALAAIVELPGLRVDGPVPAATAGPGAGGGQQHVTATIRFGYAAGERLARLLKAELVRAATARRPRVAGRAPVPAPLLRVHLDAPELF